MTAREPPQLDTDGDLNGRQSEVLLLLAGLQLDQHLVELREGRRFKTLHYGSVLSHWTASWEMQGESTMDGRS